MDTDLFTPGSGPHWSTQLWPCQGKQSQPSKPSVHTTWCFSLQWLTFLFVPQEAGPGLCASWKWHAGSARVLSEQRARLCQLPLCRGAAQLDACPCTDASGTPARNANAEGSGKEELRNGLQPTSERLEAPHEPMPAHLSTRAGGQQHGGEGIKQPCSCSPALLTGLGLWPFWLLGTGAFLVDRSVEPAPTAKQTQ